MHEKHPTFSEPDPNAIVWRYIDFPKLVSLLDKKALFFTKASKLFDPFEGTLPEFNKISRPSVHAEHKVKFRDDESFNKFVHDMERTFRLLKPTTLINAGRSMNMNRRQCGIYTPTEIQALLYNPTSKASPRAVRQQVRRNLDRKSQLY